MEQQKQLEEMAQLVCEMARKPDTCKSCPGRKGGCFTRPKMELLFAAGYRKDSELAREIFEEIETILSKNLAMVSSGGPALYYKVNEVDNQLEELKKKYTKEQES